MLPMAVSKEGTLTEDELTINVFGVHSVYI